jgi:hypothetical protein
MSDTPATVQQETTSTVDPATGLVQTLNVKKTSFFNQVLRDQGDSPSSKRLVALVSIGIGMLVGLIFTSFAIVGLAQPALAAAITPAAMPTVNTAIEFVKWFILACFSLGGLAMGLTLPEWFSTRFTGSTPSGQ